MVVYLAQTVEAVTQHGGPAQTVGSRRAIGSRHGRSRAHDDSGRSRMTDDSGPSRTHDIVIAVPLRSPRAWASLLIGVAFVGIGLGLMIDADFGVAPADAFFTALSRTSGLSVGIVLFSLCILMVLMSWAMGLRPTIGTLISFIGIAILVDTTRAVGALIGAPEWPLGARIAWWIIGLLLFCFGVLGIFASDLGASPYDQVVRAIAYRTGRSLGLARFIVDVVFLLAAIVLGGSWGIGTITIVIVVPIVLNKALPLFKPHVHRDPLHDPVTGSGRLT